MALEGFPTGITPARAGRSRSSRGPRTRCRNHSRAGGTESPATTAIYAATESLPRGRDGGLAAQFCGGNNVEGWAVTVKDNPGQWAVAEFKSREREDDDGCDYGVIVDVPEGTTAKCNGERVR